MDTDKIIQKISELFTENFISINEQIVLFVWTRHLLEKENLIKDFPTVYFYCNWVLHPNIDRSPECGQIIYKITKSLSIMDFCKTTVSGVISIFKSLQFPELIDEFYKLFSKFKLSLFYFEQPKVWQFCNQLITEILLNKSIALNPTKNFKKYFNEITNKSKENEMMALESFSFKFYKDYYNPYDTDSTAYCFVCKNRIGASFCIPLEFNLWPVIFSKETYFDAMLFSE